MDLKTSEGTVVSLSDATFARAFNEGLVHQAVTAYQAGERAGSKANKNRAAVRGGGAKPWNQKGSGRARAGTIRSPLWRGGGVTFAAKPKSYSQKINRKQYRAAMRCIFSELARQQRLLLVEEFNMTEIKTKTAVAKLKAIHADNALIVTQQENVNLYRSIRNIPNICLCDVASLDPVVLLRFDKVVVTVDAIRKIEEWLG